MDINSLYTDMYTKEASSQSSKKISNSLKKSDLSGASDEELMDVCKQFESYFVEQVLKQAMSAFTEGDTYESGSMTTLTNFYKDSLTTQYAEKITDQQDLGLAKTLYEQMKRNLSPNIKPAEEVDDSSAVEAVSSELVSEE